MRKCRKCQIDKPLSEFQLFPNGRRKMFCISCGGEAGETTTNYQIRRIVSKALASGLITRPTMCSRCGKSTKRIIGHHPSYLLKDALEVIWCCDKCHAQIHLEENEGFGWPWKPNFKKIARAMDMSLSDLVA